MGDALSALMSSTRVSHISCQRHLNHNEIKDKIITTNSLDIYCLETSVVHFGGTVPTSHTCQDTCSHFTGTAWTEHIGAGCTIETSLIHMRLIITSYYLQTLYQELVKKGLHYNQQNDVLEQTNYDTS